MLSLDSIAKEFNMKPVLDDVSIALTEGARYVLTAANGSGKTTLLQVMAGLARPTRGHVLWDHKLLMPKHRAKIGIVLQQPILYGNLSPIENLTFFANLYGCSDAAKLAASWVERLGLRDVQDQRVKEFSKGMKQRLSIARALIHNPPLILLDEPFDGLDSHSAAQAKAVFEERVRYGATLFMVTHNLEDTKHADYHYTLNFGRLVAMR